MNEETEPSKPQITTSQWQLFFIILVVGLAGVIFYLLRGNDLDSSAALYIGLPLLMALGMSLTPKAKSAMGIVMKTLTIAILLSAVVFAEGFICILFAAPILYGVAAAVAYTVGRYHRQKSSKLETALLSTVLLLLSFEGTHEILSFNRQNQVEYSKVINSDVDGVKQQLAMTPSFDKTRSLFIRIFPLPSTSEGSGLAVGDVRKLHFIYNKWIFFNAHKGDTVFEVTEVKDNYVRFDLVKDDSYLGHYLAWQTSEVLLEPLTKNTTKVTWKLSYERKLDPIWYFGPLQHYAATLTAKTLIDNVANPIP